MSSTPGSKTIGRWRTLGLVSLLLGAGLLAAPVQAAECVALIHGLGRTPASMAPLGRDLTAKGYVVVNLAYPSTKQSIAESAAVVGRDIDACHARHAAPINFVTHSMGAILLRRYFQDHRITDAGRVVMLAPPNHGSEVVDRHGGRWWFRLATGPAGAELNTGPNSLPTTLRPIPLQIGVIAGTRSHEPWFAGDFHGPNDGKVSVESAKLAGMTDFITMDASHTFIMTSPMARDQTARFIATGRFAH
jgi:alpha-beta hydrolase superfamily lysophospholipase